VSRFHAAAEDNTPEVESRMSVDRAVLSHIHVGRRFAESVPRVHAR
jgi:hypothetical protein